MLTYVDSALHHVAKGLNRWHDHYALGHFLRLPGIDLNLRIKDGLAPLHVAIASDTIYKPGPHHYEAAERLLRAGADVHAVANQGMSCFSMAKRDTQVGRLLLKHGAVVSTGDIVSEVEDGSVDVLRELVCSGNESEADDVRQISSDHATRALQSRFAFAWE